MNALDVNLVFGAVYQKNPQQICALARKKFFHTKISKGVDDSNL